MSAVIVPVSAKATKSLSLPKLWARKCSSHAASLSFSQQLEADLSKHGITIMHRANLRSYNSHPKISKQGLAIKVPSSFVHCTQPEEMTALIIGNSKEIWPHFMSHFKSQTESSASKKAAKMEHPFDTFVFEKIEQTVQSLIDNGSQSQYDIRYYNEMSRDRLISFQTLSHVSGLAPLHPASQLCVHRTQYGPWIAFRALLLLDIPCEEGEKVESMIPKLEFDAEVEKAIADGVQEALRASREGVAGKWRKWLAIRDVIGGLNDEWKQWRYGQVQLEYHYTHNVDILLAQLE